MAAEAGDASTPMTWPEWLARNEDRLTSQNTGYQRGFARTVLPRVDGLAPEQVQVEHSVSDRNGKQRRIDFAIFGHGWKIAIEVDGRNKSGDGDWSSDLQTDTWQRQNDLGMQGWQILRFWNDQFKTKANQVECAETIRSAIEEREFNTRGQLNSSQDVGVPGAASEQGDHVPGEPDTVKRDAARWLGPRSVGLVVAVVLLIAVLSIIALPMAGDEGEPGVVPLDLDSCPETHQVKGNINQVGERIFHNPGDPFYERTNPERCFASAPEAESAGFREALT